MNSFLAVYFVLLCAFILQSSAKNHPQRHNEHIINPSTFLKPINPISPQIAGGWETTPNIHPYQVGMYITIKPDLFFCGGTLISNKHVVTACHCLYNASGVDVILGAFNIYHREPGQIRMKSKIYACHEQWNKKKIQNDIAIILLPKFVQFTERIQPVLQPTKQMLNLTGEVYVSGWGKLSDASQSYTPKLHAVNVTITQDKYCKRFFKNYNNATNICVSGEDGKSACEGDSGGPLVFYQDPEMKKPYFIGIVSFGSILCQDGVPTTYTKVAAYIDWIQAKMNTLGLS